MGASKLFNLKKKKEKNETNSSVLLSMVIFTPVIPVLGRLRPAWST
jgi:hypothetical protein